MMIRRQSLFQLSILLLSKVGGICVALLFVPLYHRLLSGVQFGAVSLVLSLQALAIIFDLGVSLTLGRDVASATTVSQRIEAAALWKGAERFLALVYLVLAATWLIWWSCAKLVNGGAHELALGIDMQTGMALLMLLWLLVLQNLGVHVLIGTQHFQRAGFNQLLGGLARAGAAALTIWFVPTVEAFVWAQLTVTFVHCGLTRTDARLALGCLQVQAMAPSVLWRKVGSMAFYGAAGAAAMQFEKPLVYAALGPAVLGSYFLASTYAMTPISILASPVAQYFQPRLVQSIALDKFQSRTVAIWFSAALSVMVLAPSLLMGIYLQDVLLLWLRTAAAVQEVAPLAMILLCAATIGALGYLPSVALIGIRDMRFLTMLSITLTALLLPSVWWAANFLGADAVAWIYLAYHAISSAALWLRALRHETIADTARVAGKIMAHGVIFIVVPLVLIGVFADSPLEGHGRWHWIAAVAAPLLGCAFLHFVWRATGQNGRAPQAILKN